MNADDGPRVAVPGELELEDRIVGGLTFRHLGYLALAAGGGALAFLGERAVPRMVLGGLLVLAGLAAAFVRPGGRPLDSWAPPITGYARRRRAGKRSAEAVPEPVPVEPPAVRVRATRPVKPAVSSRTPTARLPKPRRYPAPLAHVAVAAVLVATAAGVGALVASRQRPAVAPAYETSRPTAEEVDREIDRFLDWLLTS